MMSSSASVESGPLAFICGEGHDVGVARLVVPAFVAFADARPTVEVSPSGDVQPTRLIATMNTPIAQREKHTFILIHPMFEPPVPEVGA
jgi:hypothetical protein